MKQLRKAFTLIELLVVIAIIAILAAILFPVLAQARAAAQKTVDISNFKQVGMATMMYMADYDGGSIPSNSGGRGIPGWGFGPPDKVPGMHMSPYVKNEDVFFSPMDPNAKKDALLREHMQYMGVTNINNLTPEQRAYALMVRTNMGYNYNFLSPWRQIGNLITCATIQESEIQSPASTVGFGSSIWDRSASGQPLGGGNWVIEAPCVRDDAGNVLPPVSTYQADGTWRHYNFYGWALSNPYSWLVYGGMWPWHNQKKIPASGNRWYMDGHVIVSFMDGHVKSLPVNRMIQGCNPLANWAGRISDADLYIWDLR